VFWYQTLPSPVFPKLPPPEQRYPRAGSDPHEEAWKKMNQLRNEMKAMRKRSKSGHKLGEEFYKAKARAIEIESAFEKRDNQYVIDECDKCLEMLEKAGR
ncbi:hypothetical protein ACFL1X_11140, partial [Candidatus Hydrogenedentota bacterium]